MLDIYDDRELGVEWDWESELYYVKHFAGDDMRFLFDMGF